MPTSALISLATQYRLALLRQERAAAVRLVNAYGRLYQRLQTNIETLQGDLAALEAKGELSRWRAERLDRLKALKRQIEAEVTRYGAVVENELDQTARKALGASQKEARLLTQASLPGMARLDARIMATWQSLNPAAVESLLGFLREGSPLREGLRNQLGPAVADLVGDRLLEGIALGYNPRKTAAIIRRELGQGLNWSLRTTRTATLWSYREGTRAAYLANPDIVKGWVWQSARDERVCLSCIAMDGTVHPLTETLNDHYQGRCTMMPQTIDYADLGLNVPRRREERVQTGEEWFRAQPENVQRSMMGDGRYEAWQAGQFRFSELSHQVPDRTYGSMRVETPLKDLVPPAEQQAA